MVYRLEALKEYVICLIVEVIERRVFLDGHLLHVAAASEVCRCVHDYLLTSERFKVARLRVYSCHSQLEAVVDVELLIDVWHNLAPFVSVEVVAHHQSQVVDESERHQQEKRIDVLFRHTQRADGHLHSLAIIVSEECFDEVAEDE